MDESVFWGHLEYRVCAEIDGFRERSLRRYWCDGFLATQYFLEDDQAPRIIGLAWMGVGPRYQEEWRFTLLLDRRFESRESVAWSELLPPPNVTRWLTLDPVRKQLVIEPSVAIADATKPARLSTGCRDGLC